MPMGAERDHSPGGEGEEDEARGAVADGGCEDPRCLPPDALCRFPARLCGAQRDWEAGSLAAQRTARMTSIGPSCSQLKQCTQLRAHLDQDGCRRLPLVHGLAGAPIEALDLIRQNRSGDPALNATSNG